MEKRYVFKSLFENNITQVSCDGQKAEEYSDTSANEDNSFLNHIR